MGGGVHRRASTGFIALSPSRPLVSEASLPLPLPPLVSNTYFHYTNISLIHPIFLDIYAGKAKLW